MAITVDVLDEKIKLMKEQRDSHFAIYQQAAGALSALEHMRELVDRPQNLPVAGELTVADLEKALAANDD